MIKKRLLSLRDRLSRHENSQLTVNTAQAPLFQFYTAVGVRGPAGNLDECHGLAWTAPLALLGLACSQTAPKTPAPTTWNSGRRR